MDDVFTVVSFLKEMMLVTNGSSLTPMHIPWRESYKVQKTIIYPVIEKVSKQAKTVSEALYAAFNMYRRKNKFISSVLGEILAANANGEVLDVLLHLYASRSFSLTLHDAIHDGLIKRGVAFVPRLATYVEDMLEEEKQQEANDLLFVLSKIRSDVAFECLKRFYKDEDARRLLPDENFLEWFLNQGKGAEFLKNSAIVERIPEQAASTIKKLENGTYPSKDSLFSFPQVERKPSDIAHGLQAVWKKEDAKAMRACAECGKNTQSHLLPGGKVLCHECFKQGKAIPYFNRAISKRRDWIEQDFDEREMEIKLFQEIGEYYKNKQEFSKVLTLCQRLLEKYPHNSSLLTTYASLFQAMGDEKREKEVYETMKETSPYCPETYKHLGSFYRRQGNYTKAISYFTHALRLTVDQREAFASEIPRDEIKDTIHNLTTLIEERVHSLPPREPRKKGSIMETGLLPEEKKLFPKEKQPKKAIHKLSAKLLEIKKLEREHELDKKIQEARGAWQTAIKKLSQQENPYLPVLKQMVTTYPTKQVLNELDRVLKELEKVSYLDTYLLLLIAKLSTPQAIPIQYTFMDFERFGDWADRLKKSLSNQGTLCLQFLSIELKERRVPMKNLPTVWKIMTNINEEKSLKSFLKYVSQPIPPEVFQTEGWQDMLKELTKISDPIVGQIFEELQENFAWFKPAYNLVNRYYNDWKYADKRE